MCFCIDGAAQLAAPVGVGKTPPSFPMMFRTHVPCAKSEPGRAVTAIGKVGLRFADRIFADVLAENKPGAHFAHNAEHLEPQIPLPVPASSRRTESLTGESP